jgi:hypothetical protein
VHSPHARCRQSRLSLDPALGRQGAVDGGWWPHSRNASVELPALISSLNNRIGGVLRLGVDAREWDDIPRRLTISGHPVRIGRFADLDHKIIVTLSGGDLHPKVTEDVLGDERGAIGRRLDDGVPPPASQPITRTRPPGKEDGAAWAAPSSPVTPKLAR